MAHRAGFADGVAGLLRQLDDTHQDIEPSLFTSPWPDIEQISNEVLLYFPIFSILGHAVNQLATLLNLRLRLKHGRGGLAFCTAATMPSPTKARTLTGMCLVCPLAATSDGVCNICLRLPSWSAQMCVPCWFQLCNY